MASCYLIIVQVLQSGAAFQTNGLQSTGKQYKITATMKF